MNPRSPRIAIPEPSAIDPDYSRRSWPVYANAVEQAGGTAVKLPLDQPPAILAGIIRSCSGVLLPGSPADIDPEKYGERPADKCNPKDPLREAADELLLQDAFNLRKPLFGICYGMQSVNVWKSGTLIQDLPSIQREQNVLSPVNHRPGREVQHAHVIAIRGDSRISGILGPSGEAVPREKVFELSVNSSHHQAVGQPGDDMRVVARSAQDGVIEALEGETPTQFVLGVQWHPERTYEASAASRALFAAFVAAARDWRPHPIEASVATADEAK